MFTFRFSYLLVALLGVALFASAGPSWVWAQQTIPQTPFVTPNVKDYGRPGYPVMTVYVWGSADTGVWNVEEGTDLLEFVSVISRAQFGERPDTRSTQVLKLYRNGRTEGAPYFEAQIQDLFARRDGYPALQEGDILLLETKVKGRFTWRDVSRIVGIAATVLNTFLILDRLQN